MISVPHFRQVTGTKTCLVTSIRMVLSYLGVDRSEEEIGTAIKLDPVVGAGVMNIELLPQEWGITSESGEISIETLKETIDCPIPVLVVVRASFLPYRDPSIRTNHTLVVVGYDDDNIYVNDALRDEFPIEIPWTHFLRAWNRLGNFAGIIRKLTNND